MCAGFLYDYDFVKRTFEMGVAQRRDKANGAKCSIGNLKTIVADWQSRGAQVVFTAGVYDTLHINHILALTHYRLLAAEKYLNDLRAGLVDDASVVDVAASNKIRLVVSVDSDKRVERDKAFIFSKGNAPKPIISWENRTFMLLKQYLQGLSRDIAIPLVDFVTRHGLDTCSSQLCAHDDNVTIAEEIMPDLLIVNKDSVSTVSAVRSSKKLANRKITFIDGTKLFYSDPLLEGPVKSSAIIKRARMSGSSQILSKK